MKRRNTTPAIAPYVDQWGNPAWSNPCGQYRPNPALNTTAQPATNAQPQAVPAAQPTQLNTPISTVSDSAHVTIDREALTTDLAYQDALARARHALGLDTPPPVIETKRLAADRSERGVRIHRRIHRTVAVVVAIGSGFVGITAASAMWSSHGTGAGKSKATAFQALTADVTGTVTSSLLPGGTADLHMTVTNPNQFQVKITAIQQTPSTSITVTGGIGTGAGRCTTANAGVSVSLTQPSLPFTITAVNGATQIVDLSGGASMTVGSATGCQQASFTIPVTLTVSQS
jgi:hypothetical protein